MPIFTQCYGVMAIHGMQSEKLHREDWLRITEISFTQFDVIDQLINDGNREHYVVAGGEKPQTTKIWLVAMTDIHFIASSWIHFLPYDLWPRKTMDAGSVKRRKLTSLLLLEI